MPIFDITKNAEGNTVIHATPEDIEPFVAAFKKRGYPFELDRGEDREYFIAAPSLINYVLRTFSAAKRKEFEDKALPSQQGAYLA